MKEIGRKISKKEMVSKRGQMEQSMKEITWMVKSTEMDYLSGQMAQVIKENFSTTIFKEQVFFILNH